MPDQMLKLSRYLSLVVCLLLSACGGSNDGPKDASKKDGKPKSSDGKAVSKVDALKLEETTVGSVPAFKAGDVYLAGQPSEDDLKKFAEAGGKTVVSLRLPDENVGFDESVAVGKLGMKFNNPGFRAADTLTDPVFWGVRELLRDKSQHPLLLHCASANRVGAMWLAHRVLDGELSYEDAMTEAKRVGLKPAAYEAVVKAYIEKEKKN